MTGCVRYCIVMWVGSFDCPNPITPMHRHGELQILENQVIGTQAYHNKERIPTCI